MVQIEDIYDIIENKKNSWNKFIFLLLIIVFFICIIIYFIKYLKTKKSPEIVAIDSLKSLNIEEFFSEKKLDIFYEKVSGIIKNFFSEKSKKNFLSLSDAEFREAIKNLIKNNNKIDKELDINKININLELLINIFADFEKIKFDKDLNISKEKLYNDINNLNKIIFAVKNNKFV